MSSDFIKAMLVFIGIFAMNMCKSYRPERQQQTTSRPYTQKELQLQLLQETEEERRLVKALQEAEKERKLVEEFCSVHDCER